MTERGLEKSLRCIVTQVSREKMLPKILCHAVRELGSKRLATYQRAVRKQYELFFYYQDKTQKHLLNTILKKLRVIARNFVRRFSSS